MNIDSTVPPAFSADLGYLQPADVPRLMSSLVALGAEVFMLKAEVQRLRCTLLSQGVVSADDIERQSSSEQMKSWMEREQNQFAAALLDPLARPA